MSPFHALYDDLDRLVEWKVNDVSQKTWDYDGQGNDLDSGTYNAANEMTPTVDSSGYDAAGNMTTLQSGDTAVYDAWNRMVEVNDGEDIIQQNEYDGTNRRIQIFSDFTGATPGATQDDYYTGQQIIETHEDSAVKYQNIWSPRYIDSLILRDTLSSGQIVTADRIFYLSDANFNVTGLVKYNSGTSDWEVAERYTYTPYGVATFRNASWTNVGNSANSNATLYTGRYLDLLTSIYYYRARFYDAALERFISRDPIAADYNLYRYVGSSPLNSTDPSGNVKVSVLGNNCADAKCGGAVFAQWDFEVLDLNGKGAPCAGYIVQHVISIMEISFCNNGCCERSGNYRTIEYWEAWPVRQYQNLSYITAGPGYTDQGRISIINNTCGSVFQIGEVRFYSVKDTGPILNSSKWHRGHWYGDNSPQSPYRVYVGVLPSTDKMPDFWKKTPIGVIDSRLISADWNCCKNTDISHYGVDAWINEHPLLTKPN